MRCNYGAFDVDGVEVEIKATRDFRAKLAT